MNIGIIGGGASGMILASKLDKHKVTILDGNNKLGKKLLLTGNGKCNFTNMNFDNLDYIYNCELAKKLYKKYDNISFIKYLNSLGIVAKIETHKGIDYVYPNNNKSSSVYYSLLDKILDNNVSIVYNAKVSSVSKINDKFEVNTIDDKKYVFDKLVFAFGGTTYKKTGSDGSCFNIAKKLGLKVNDTIPGLTPLKYRIENINNINFTGFRIDALVSVKKSDNNIDNNVEEFGEIQFTKEYISGIPILNISSKISRDLNKINELVLNLDFSSALIKNKIIDKNDSQVFYDSDLKLNIIKDILTERKSNILYKRVEDFLCGFLPDELNSMIFEILKLKNKKVRILTSDDLYNIAKIITSFRIKVIKNNSYENAQITVGGIDLEELNDDTLESKTIKGLYVIGEALDIDGICGGYNLQMCYSTASIVVDNLLSMEE